MAIYQNGPIQLHHDVEGDGFPVLVLAPGGMSSANDLWSRAPWNPRRQLVDRYRVIGMDQRNAGASVAPVSAADGWHTYARDQLDLLDHLGVDRCHVIGMCIGGPFVISLLLAAPERFCCAVALQPAGIDSDDTVLRDLFDQWSADLADSHPEVSRDDWHEFGDAMWGGDFVLSATREQAATIETPLLVMMGNDQYHPQSVSRELATLVPGCMFVERWKDDEVLADTDATISRFLAEHTPS